MSELRQENAGIEFDNLIGGTSVTALTANVTLQSTTGVIKKGSILTKNTEGKYELASSGKTASSVLKEDVTLSGADVVAIVYTKGLFNRQALIVAAGDTVESHEDELRDMGIYLTSAI